MSARSAFGGAVHQLRPLQKSGGNGEAPPPASASFVKFI